MRAKKLLPLLLLSLLFLAGCSNQSEPSEIEITLFHGWGGANETHQAMRGLYADFSMPQIRLTCLPFSDNERVVEKAIGMLQTDEMIDIVSTNGNASYVQMALKRGVALDLMPYIEKDPVFRACIPQTVFDTWLENGKLYTLPDALEMIGYWYNEDILQNAGIVDQAGQVTPPKTWDEFLAMVAQFQEWNVRTRAGVAPYVLDTVQLCESLFPAALAGQGPDGLSMMEKMPTSFRQPVLEETLSLLALLTKYASVVDGIDNARQLFLDGKTALYFNGVWENTALEGMQRLRYAPYPSVSGKSIAFVSASSGYVVRVHPDAQRTEASVAFLKHILSNEVQTRIAAETGQAPSNPNVDLSNVQRDNPLLSQALHTVNNADIKIKTLMSVWSPATIAVLNERLMKTCLGEQSTDSLINQLEATK